MSKRQGCIQLSGCGQTIDTCWSSTVFNTFETWPSLNYVPNAGDTSQINYNGDFCQHTGTACQFSEGAIANHDTCVCGAQLCDASLGEVFCVLSSKGTCSATQAKATGDCEFTTGQIANKKPCICGSTQCNQAGSFCNLFSGCSLGCTAAQNGNVCLNGGFAAGKEGNCRCACIPGYLGENCQAATPCTHGANGQSCQNDATVLGTVIENNCRCQCTNGYDGDHCETAVSCTNGANGQACQNDATVTGTIAADDCKCTCTVGFSGNNCETIIDVDCPGTFTDDEATNHFTAACSGVTTNAATCALTVSAGYGGGSVTCDTADGVYDVVAATATPCAGTFTDDEPTNHFTAVCTDKIAHGATCVLTLSAGYAGGSVTCNTADGKYDVIAADAVAGKCAGNKLTATDLAEASTPAGTFQFACGAGSTLKASPAAIALAGTDAAAKLATCCDANKVTVPAPTPTLLAPSPTVVGEADTGGAPTATVSIAACAVVLAAFFM